MRDDFAIFILSNGRAKEISTYDALKNAGYTGKIYIIVDDLDTQLSEYKERFGEQVIVFDKKAWAERTDTVTATGELRSVDYRGEVEKVRNDFAVFILSHGRSDRVFTLKPLLDGGYTGKWYIIIDDEDDQADDYFERYGDHVYQFSKAAYDDTFDIMDLHTDRRVVVYARNACFDIAKELGIRYFLVLDDDYNAFMYRFPEGDVLKYADCKQLDDLFDAMVNFLIVSGSLSIAFAQGGDFIGGLKGGGFQKKLIRKVMNTWFCDAEKPFKIIGRINEDTNSYVYYGTQGKLFFTITDVMINQKQTQSNAGGLTDIYLDRGTYVKSFYTVMCAPSCCKIAAMGDKHIRVHHKVDWTACTPKIINEKWKKAGRK